MLLTVDGVLCALAAAFLLPSYLGPIWFPVSALVAGLVNVALVWAAMRWTSSARLAALPLISWALTIVIMAMGGPGADRILDGAGVAGFGSVLLMLLGAIPPILLLKREST